MNNDVFVYDIIHISFNLILNGKDKRNSRYALEATIVMLSTDKRDDDSQQKCRT